MSQLVFGTDALIIITTSESDWKWKLFHENKQKLIGINNQKQSAMCTVMYQMIRYLRKPGVIPASVPKDDGTLHYTEFQTNCEYTCKVRDKVVVLIIRHNMSK